MRIAASIVALVVAPWLGAGGAVAQSSLPLEKIRLPEGFSIELAARCRIAYVDDILLHKRDHAASDSKTITTDEHVRELRAICEAVQPLVHTHATDAEAHAIEDAWQRLFAAREQS